MSPALPWECMEQTGPRGENQPEQLVGYDLSLGSE